MYDILLPSVVIRLLIKSSSQLAAVVFPSPPLTPKRDPQICPPYLWWLFLAVFSPPKGLLSLSFSLPPSLLLQKCVISPSHHHRVSKTAHRYTVYFLRTQMNPPMRKPRFQKKGGLKTRKRKTWPRSENPSKCIHVSCRWKKKKNQPPLSGFSFYTASKCLHTYRLSHKQIFTDRPPPPFESEEGKHATGLTLLHVHLHSEKIGRGALVAAHSHRERPLLSAGGAPWTRKVKRGPKKRVFGGYYYYFLPFSSSENSRLHWRGRRRWRDAGWGHTALIEPWEGRTDKRRRGEAAALRHMAGARSCVSGTTVRRKRRPLRRKKRTATGWDPCWPRVSGLKRMYIQTAGN